MKEKAVYFECPECGEVEQLTAAEIAQKIVREESRYKAGQIITPRRNFATEDGDEITND